MSKTKVRLSETPERHVLYAWDRYIRKASSEDIYFVANGYGGVLVQYLLTERAEARDRTRAIALTSSSHNWNESVGKEGENINLIEGSSSTSSDYRTPARKKKKKQYNC